MPSSSGWRPAPTPTSLCEWALWRSTGCGWQGRAGWAGQRWRRWCIGVTVGLGTACPSVRRTTGHHGWRVSSWQGCEDALWCRPCNTSRTPCAPMGAGGDQGLAGRGYTASPDPHPGGRQQHLPGRRHRARGARLPFACPVMLPSWCGSCMGRADVADPGDDSIGTWPAAPWARARLLSGVW